MEPVNNKPEIYFSRITRLNLVMELIALPPALLIVVIGENPLLSPFGMIAKKKYSFFGYIVVSYPDILNV